MSLDGNNGSRRSWVVTWGALAAAGTIGFTVVGGAVAILNWQYNESNRLRAELTAVQVEFAKNQVTKPEFSQAIKDLNERFERGFDRLEKRLSDVARQPAQR